MNAQWAASKLIQVCCRMWQTRDVLPVKMHMLCIRNNTTNYISTFIQT